MQLFHCSGCMRPNTCPCWSRQMRCSKNRPKQLYRAMKSRTVWAGCRSPKAAHKSKCRSPRFRCSGVRPHLMRWGLCPNGPSQRRRRFWRGSTAKTCCHLTLNTGLSVEIAGCASPDRDGQLAVQGHSGMHTNIQTCSTDRRWWLCHARCTSPRSAANRTATIAPFKRPQRAVI